MKKEAIPNVLTFSRIGLSIVLLLIPFGTTVFAALYLLCGLTDVLDGFLARRLHAESETGAALDSLADVCLTALIIVTVLRRTDADLPVLIAVGGVFVLRAGNAVVSRLRFGRVLSIHTVANKAAGLLLYACPLLLPWLYPAILWLAGGAALLASLEELLILLGPEKPDVNRRSIFTR